MDAQILFQLFNQILSVLAQNCSMCSGLGTMRKIPDGGMLPTSSKPSTSFQGKVLSGHCKTLIKNAIMTGCMPEVGLTGLARKA